jgi:hypothetical protein
MCFGGANLDHAVTIILSTRVIVGQVHERGDDLVAQNVSARFKARRMVHGASQSLGQLQELHSGCDHGSAELVFGLLGINQLRPALGNVDLDSVGLHARQAILCGLTAGSLGDLVPHKPGDNLGRVVLVRLSNG